MNSQEPLLEMFTIEPGGQDLRWVGPVHECPLCEHDLFHVLAKFDEGLPAFYLLDGICSRCGSQVKLPCPEDVL